MERRAFLVGLGTVAASSAIIPAVLAAPILTDREIWESELRAHWQSEVGTDLALRSRICDMTVKAADMAGIDKFVLISKINNYKHYQSVRRGSDDRMIVSRPLKCIFQQELADDLRYVCGLDAEAELENILVEEMAMDLRNYDEWAANGIVLHSIYPYNQVDPVSFMPQIRFAVRYAYA